MNRSHPLSWCLASLLVVGASLFAPLTAHAATPPPQAAAAPQAAKPNIVLIFPDNLGWGEVGAFGSVRGVPTPRIDSIATDGIKLTNFNVEFSCVVSRAALMTSRYAVRTGAVQEAGMTLWETTMAESLKNAGYATALFGKWHLGGTNWMANKRAPTDQGFDEWYGIPLTSNEAQKQTLPGFVPGQTEVPGIFEGKAGQPSTKVKDFDLVTRRTVDRECAQKGVAFMEKNVQSRTPFFLYYPITQIHFPTLAHPDFDGKTGAGDIGDAMADVDFNTGLILDAVKRLGIEQNTIVIWCTDNGSEARRPWRGTSGPWSGFYNSVMEGGIRTPCVIKWPGHIPPGQVSNEIFHQMDFFPTFAAAAGFDMPKDRAIDGVNQLAFLEGKQKKSNRDSVLFFTSNTTPAKAVKWKDWKLHYQYQAEPQSANGGMRLFNLRSDPKEESDIKDGNPWVQGIMDKIVADFQATTTQYPNVPQNSRDPYTPPVREPLPSREAARPALNKKITTASGLVYEFTKQGTGPWPNTGDTLVMHGIGKFTDGKEFWNTRTTNQPYSYRLGVDRVISGFSEGMRFVREGDRIVITMKPEQGYGARGNNDIPPNSTLIFDYEILTVKPQQSAEAAIEPLFKVNSTTLVASIEAQAKPNFAGRWSNDAAGAVAPGGGGRGAPGGAPGGGGRGAGGGAGGAAGADGGEIPVSLAGGGAGGAGAGGGGGRAGAAGGGRAGGGAGGAGRAGGAGGAGGAGRGPGGGRGGPGSDAGSGWGSPITVTQNEKELTVQYTFFVQGDMQPAVRFAFALDGTESSNTVMMGRGIQLQKSKSVWDGDKLVITTLHAFNNPDTNAPMTQEVKQTLSLVDDTLVIEVWRAGVLGGRPVTSRSVYRKVQ